MNKFKILLILSLSLILADASKQDIGISGSIGMLSPTNNKTRSEYSVGYTTGLMIKFPKKIKILKYDFKICSEMNISMLNGNEIENINITSAILHLETNLKKSPFDIRFGGGIANHTYSGITGLTNLDFIHKMEFEKINVSIGLRLQQIINITDNYKFDFNHSLYGININFGKFLN